MAEESVVETTTAVKADPVIAIPGLGDLPVSGQQSVKREHQSEDESTEARVAEGGDELMKEEADSGTPPPKKKRRPNKRRGGILGIETQRATKNALMLLNELRPGLTYEVVSQEGPTHCPTFVVCVVVDGHSFEGKGSSKQKAKLNAAENAFRSFITQMRTPAQQLLPDSQAEVGQRFDTDFTSDNTGTLLNTFGNSDQSTLERETEGSVPMATESTPPSSKVKSPQVQTDAGKHPATLLNEFYPGLHYEFLGQEGDGNEKKFRFKLNINGQEFVGVGSSKKKGKANAASRALFALHSIRTFYTFAGQSEARSQPVYLGPPPSAQLDQGAADLIADAVLTKFQSLQSSTGNEPLRRKVLASIVMTSRGDSDQKFEVISLGTGTKFISGEYMSDQGLAVNDCHGEIIARRSFLRFLFSQLELCAEGYEEDSIFEKKDSGLYGVRDYVEFHLFINTSPCGDARIFSPHEPVIGEADKHPGRRKRGLLRVKLENGEGTIPAINGGTTIQTWDGVLQGERLRTMSCSDKLCRWNVTGVQGSLLSHFLEPIYLHSIVLGSLYHYEHMSRAMYQRLGDLEGLPPRFKQNRPLMNGTSTPETRVTVKSPNISANWSEGDESFEVVNATTGMLQGEEVVPSRLCKQSLFKLFIAVWKKLKPSEAVPLSYHEAKKAVTDYQKAKHIVMRGFDAQGLGMWIRKPCEQDMFELSGQS